MRVRQPGMHRRQTGFCAVTDEREQECQLDKPRVQLVRHDYQVGPVEAGQRLGIIFAGGGINENGAKQRQRQSQAPEHHIFPRGFERSAAVVKRD